MFQVWYTLARWWILYDVFAEAVRVFSPPLIRMNDVSGAAKFDATRTVSAVRNMYVLVRAVPKEVDICMLWMHRRVENDVFFRYNG